jgi:hypothetical protein
VWVYSTGHTPVKPPPPTQTLIINPFAHVGQKAVPGSWYTKDGNGGYVGKQFEIVFEYGRYDADEAMARYLLENGFASDTPWRPATDEVAADPGWRWRDEGRV